MELQFDYFNFSKWAKHIGLNNLSRYHDEYCDKCKISAFNS